VETEGIHAAGFMGTTAEKEMIERTPLGRMGQPEDLAKVAVFFASDDATWVTGERLGRNTRALEEAGASSTTLLPWWVARKIRPAGSTAKSSA
jgi:NAD(P)-dependent dehydrogenase (short-subunit alcohol dehydrogenase family)